MFASVVIAALATAVPVASAAPVNTSFTYQGQLKNNGSPVNTPRDFKVALYDRATSAQAGAGKIGNPLTVPCVQVVNGLFTLILNFPDPNSNNRVVNCPVNVVWVDFNFPCTSCGQGTFDDPYNDLVRGRDNVPAGGTVAIKAGSSTETITIRNFCILQAYGGPVSIGR